MARRKLNVLLYAFTGKAEPLVEWFIRDQPFQGSVSNHYIGFIRCLLLGCSS